VTYDVTLVQVNASIFGMAAVNTSMGFPTTNFDTILFSFWTCLPNTIVSGISHYSNGGPSYIGFFELAVLPGGNSTLKLGTMATATYFFDAVFDSPVITDLRSHHLISVNCATQTVQYYVNDVPVELASGGWTASGHFRTPPSSNIWDFDVGSSLGFSYPAFADIWMSATPSFVDLFIPANRRKFINADLTPVDLGPNGSLPLGSQPQIFQTILPSEAPNDFLINRGTGIDFFLTSGSTLSFQEAGTCTVPSPPICEIIETGLIWPITGGVSMLGLVADNQSTRANAVSGDGSVIAGQGNDAASSQQPARWNRSATLTGLTPSLGAIAAHAMSQDGSIIYGSNDTLSGGTIIRWTSSGTDALSPLPGFDGCAINFLSGPYRGRQCSDDGSILVGVSSLSGSSLTITVWTDGVPSALPLPDIAEESSAVECSQDGSVIVGDAESYPSFWTGGEYFPLIFTISGVNHTISLIGCNGDGSNIFGNAAFGFPVYWDNLGHATSGDPVFGTVWGDIHVLADLPGSTHRRDTTVTFAADSGGISVGWGSDSSGADTAIRWTGTTAEALDRPDGWIGARAWGCNSDGSIVVGEVDDPDFKTWACYWDVDGAIHILPSLADPDDFSQGVAVGISRDSSLIYGYGDRSCSPPTLSDLTIDDLFVTQSAGVIDTEHLTLRWSDDAGYTWSNGLLKSLGRRGEYNTSPTYYRLGMSRNRIFEVYWSGAQAEALVGVWVNFTIAGS